MLHVTPGTVYVTAGVWHALQDMSSDPIAYVILHAGIRIIIVPLVPAVMESVVPWEIVATADAYRAHLGKSLAKTVCAILPAAVRDTARPVPHV